MSSDLALRLEDIGKRYRLDHRSERHDTLAKALTSRLKRPVRRNRPQDFWALRDVNLTVDRGEVLGIVGHNGAGKSTLLKVLTRITHPTTGTLDVWGRVGSLLEVGTGFHPDLTGRENIFLNGSILGMRQREIARSFDDIVQFAEVEQFLDTPVKRYSSGMYVRLAFAVAAHLEADVLLVDEVLAVGDADFQQRCLGKMNDVAQSGRTVVFVSHQLQSVRNLCTRALLLEHGTAVMDGPVTEVLNTYLSSLESTNGERSARPAGTLAIGRVRVRQSAFDCAEPKDITITVPASDGPRARYWLALHVADRQGNQLLQLDSRLVGWMGRSDQDESLTLRLIAPWLKPGRYRVDGFLCDSGGIVDRWEAAASFAVAAAYPYALPASEDSTGHGLVLAAFIRVDDSDAPA